jgi:uncharacterized protein
MNREPPNATPTAPLSDAEVSELDELLQSLPDDLDPLDVEMLDGFLAALLLQPAPVSPAEWLPFVFDVQGRDAGLPDTATKRAIDLIMRRHNELAAYIAAREPFEPIIFELEDDQGNPMTGKAAIAALEPWAEGFMNALAAFPALLEQLEGDTASSIALTGVLRHLPSEPDDASDESQEYARNRAAYDRDDPLADLDEAIAVLVDSVMEMADITRPRRPASRESPKVGRNDPCPCGSGRKFKHCHGASVH